MPKYIIEREIPGAGNLTAEDLRAIADKSCGVLRELGTDIQWVQSFVAENKIYCVYLATDPDLVRTHARLGGFPADVVTAVTTVIDPATAEQPVLR